MAINPIQVPGHAPIPEKEEDLLSKIAKGIEIAGGILKIPTLYTEWQKNVAEKGLKQKELESTERLERGELFPTELSKYKLIPTKEGEPGAMKINVRGEGGKLTPTWVKPSGDLNQLLQETTIMKNLQDLKSAPLKEKSAELEIEQKKEALATPSTQQSSAALFARRMEQAENVFTDLISKGFNRGSVSAGLKSNIPIEAWKPSDIKRQQQAEQNFLSAVLRDESGAAISDKEIERAAPQYFPRSGDSPEVVEQKRQNREQVIEGLKAEAGKALEKVKPVQRDGKKQFSQEDLLKEAKKRGLIGK